MLPPIQSFAADPAPLGSNPPSPKSGTPPKPSSPYYSNAPMAIIPPEPLTLRQRMQDAFCGCFKPTVREPIYIGACTPLLPLPPKAPPRG